MQQPYKPVSELLQIYYNIILTNRSQSDKRTFYYANTSPARIVRTVLGILNNKYVIIASRGCRRYARRNDDNIINYCNFRKLIYRFAHIT